MKQNLLRSLNYFSILLYGLVAVSASLMFFDGIKNIVPDEFIINYQFGLIKRGFIGSILFWLCGVFNLKAAVLVSTFVYLLIAANIGAIVYFFVKRKLDLFILLSSFLFLNLYGYHIIFRLDLALTLVFIVQLLLLKTKSLSTTSKFVLSLILSCIGILIHEVYFFLSVFSISFIFWQHLQFRNNALLVLSVFVQGVLFFSLIKFFPGNLNQINQIIASWSKFGIDPNQHQYLRWLFDLKKPILIWQNEPYTNNKKYFVGFILNYFIVVAALIFYIHTFFKIGTKAIALFLAVNFLTILVLCCVATDFIRWYYLVSMVILLYFCFFVERKSFQLTPKYVIFKFAVLFIGLPMYGWTPTHFYWTTPIKYLLNLKDYF